MSLSSPLFAEWLLRGMLLSVAAAAIYVLLKPGGKARGTLLAVTTAGLLFLPFALWVSPRWTLGWIPFPELGAVSAGPIPGVGTDGASPWVMIWFCGVALCLARLGIGFLSLGRFRKDAGGVFPAGEIVRRCAAEAAGEMGIKVPRVAISDRVSIPFVTGLFQPRIFLPPGANVWSPTVLRAVLLHEMAHVRRGDLWMQVIGNVVCALYWFNPVVWFLHRRLAGEREYLADALVVECGTDARRYAHALLDVAASNPSIPGAAPLAAAIGLNGASKLEERIRRVVRGNSVRSSRLRCGGALVIGLLSVAASACLDPFAKPPEKAPDPADPPADHTGDIWTEEEVEKRLSASPFPSE